MYICTALVIALADIFGGKLLENAHAFISTKD